MVSASKAARDAKRAAEGKPVKKTVAGRSKAGSTTTSGASTPPLLDAEGEPILVTEESLKNAKKADEGASHQHSFSSDQYPLNILQI
jgi:ATP-binding cassette subfamily F protein 2